MSLIVMVVWDTEDNKRFEYTQRSIDRLLYTVDWSKHRLFISDNGSCADTQKYYKALPYLWWNEEQQWGDAITIHKNGSNIGTAKALNEGLKTRKPGEFVIKMDGDILVDDLNWVEQMEQVMVRCPEYGIVGLKRKDLAQHPENSNLTFKSELRQLPHQPGQTWITVEEHRDIIGSCTMFNPVMLDVINASFQPGIYGFEDNLTSLRSVLSGFKNCFLPHIVIEHIDRGDNPYTEYKRELANDKWDEYRKIHQQYVDGVRPIFEEY